LGQCRRYGYGGGRAALPFEGADDKRTASGIDKKKKKRARNSESFLGTVLERSPSPSCVEKYTRARWNNTGTIPRQPRTVPVPPGDRLA